MKLTSIYLAGATTWACGGPAATDCAQTATCDSIVASDGGQPGSSAMTKGDAATSPDATTVDADGAVIEAVTPDTGVTDVVAPKGCQTDDDCALGTICSSQTCVPGCSDKHGCQGADACCNGQCFDTQSDAQHCGGCSACDVAHASAACTNGSCTVATCSPGFADCDGKADNGCELAQPTGPSVPSPTRPVAGDYTGSFRANAAVNTLRPTFKWTATAPDTCGAVTYQIQLDDSCTPGEIQSCTFASPEVDATVSTNSFQPSTALAVQKTQPVGTRYYWRVRACDAAKVCSSWSTVRYVEVGRARDDLNGDGYSDLLVRGGADNLYIYFGGSTPSTQVAVHGKPGTSFAFGGDLDADGYADLLVGDPNVNQGAGSFGAVLVYLGKATWGSELDQHETIYHTADATHGFPAGVSGAGDFDGDGRADIMASAAQDASISIFLDPAGRFATPAFIKVNSNDPGTFQDQFGRAGDVDGDGISDIAVLFSPDGNSSSVSFFQGSANPSNLPMKRQTVDGPRLSVLRPAGDLDGDGFDDVALAGLSPMSTLVTIRGQRAFATTGGIASSRTFSDDNVAFHGLAGGWDVNGDGRSDLYWTAVEGYALLSIPGAADFSAQSPASSVDATSSGVGYGTALAMGDYDGDGSADLAVAAMPIFNNPTGTGAVSIRLAKGSVIQLTAPSMVGFGAALGH